MPSAARVGDKTAHASTPLGPGPGSTNVLIGNKPAWRAVTDKHSCPLSTGNVAHASGTVMSGSTSVLINDFGAVRQGDQVTEVGATNPIVEGCATVIIG